MSAMIINGEYFTSSEFDHPRYPHLRIFSADEHGVRRPRFGIDGIVPLSEDKIPLRINDVRHGAVRLVTFVNDRPATYAIFDIRRTRIFIVPTVIRPDCAISHVAFVHLLNNTVLS